MDFFDIEILIKKIGILLEEIEIYESKLKKRKVSSFDHIQIGYPCGLRRRNIRQNLSEDFE